MASNQPSPRDVARLAGVSQSAVSRTFTAGSSVSDDTRVRVVQAAKALNYTPNYAARSLVTNRSSIIGVAMSHLDNQYYPEVLERLSEALALIGYRVLLFITHAESDHEPVLQELMRHRVDALVLASRSLSASLGVECRDQGLPVVMFNSVAPGSDIAGVAGSNLVGGATIAAYLIAGGHRRFGLIAGTDDSLTGRERGDGFAAMLQTNGLPTPMRAPGHFNFAAASVAARDLLGSDAPPDAIFCANDHMALAAIQVARTEFGLTVGANLSIVGFDDTAISGWPLFGLTTYSQPASLMVERVMALLRRALDRHSIEGMQETVPGKLVVRSSARRPPQGLPTISKGWRSGSRTWRLRRRSASSPLWRLVHSWRQKNQRFGRPRIAGSRRGEEALSAGRTALRTRTSGYAGCSARLCWRHLDCGSGWETHA